MISLFLSSLLTLVSLNCENLFDCRHDSLKNDYEWLPEGTNRWTQTRYWHKLNNIGREILACGEQWGDFSSENTRKSTKKSEKSTWKLPDLVALSEIENDSVRIRGDQLARCARHRRGAALFALHVPPAQPPRHSRRTAERYAPDTRHPLRQRTSRFGRYTPHFRRPRAQSFGWRVDYAAPSSASGRAALRGRRFRFSVSQSGENPRRRRFQRLCRQ